MIRKDGRTVPDEWVGRIVHDQTKRKRREMARLKRKERRRRLRRASDLAFVDEALS